MLNKAIELFKVFMAPEVGPAVQEVLYSGYIAQGSQVDKFEVALERWLGTDDNTVLSVNSGTSALQLACTLAGVKAGTRVISTPMTCTATNTAIRAAGGDIVWADINPTTGNIDPASVEKILRGWRFEAEPVAIMGVDWGGLPCDWKALQYIAKRYNVKLIEDGAHAFGATYHGRKAGHFADFTCFSFQAIKHLTTIDGGAVVCLDHNDYARGKLLRWFGIDRDQPRKDFRCEADVVEPGYKYHMNDVNATVGLHQLPYMNGMLSSHRFNAYCITEELRNLTGELKGLTLPKYTPSKESAWWFYPVLVNDRDSFMKYMLAHSVTVSQVHSRNDKHTMFKDYQTKLPGVDAFAAKQCNLPCGWWLGDYERAYIVSAVKNYLIESSRGTA